MKIGIITLAVLAVSAGVRAESELDGARAKAPAVIVSQLNPVTQTVSNYQVPADNTVRPDALANLSETERAAKVQSFLNGAVRPENKISEVKVEKVTSELDNTGSTAACRWRWRGYYNTGYYYNGYYGGGYYGGDFYYSTYTTRYYYQPSWTYANSYYYRGGYQYTYPSYRNCYYTTYFRY